MEWGRVEEREMKEESREGKNEMMVVRYIIDIMLTREKIK